MTAPVFLTPVAAAAAILFAVTSAIAQSPATPAVVPPIPGQPAAAPTAAPAATTATTPAPQRVDVQGGRDSTTDQRRQSTAAKIIISREDIERFGDTNLGDMMRRLPGVTTGGAPGRGGAIRMRGLGAGFTQILIDGERLPPGFSIQSLTPEQVERIEILRAPTAETGAQAIAGTINIITREGFSRKLNELRFGFAYENGRFQPGASWTRNDKLGDMVYNLSMSVFRQDRANEATTTTLLEDLTTGAKLREQAVTTHTDEMRNGVNVSSRMQWKLGESGSLTLIPIFFHVESDTATRSALTQTIGATPPLFDRAASERGGRFSVVRLNGHWAQRLESGLRAEVRGGVSASRAMGNSVRQEFNAANTLLRTLDDRSSSRDQTLTLNAKGTKLLEGDHSLVFGAELEAAQRTESRTTLQNGLPLLVDFGNDLDAVTARGALYAQNEWQLTPQWSAHAGLRWEGMSTRGQGIFVTTQTNRSSVLTPLLHGVWKLDPKSKDQIRVSLTRSYRPPTLQNLLGRPSISALYPVPLANTATSPDRAGNPTLKPELATGIDVALERYLSQAGGMFSVNVFHRQISDVMRTVTSLETVSWATQPRWVARPQNIGDAFTQGIELEAKFRLTEWWKDAPRVDLRANASLFNSKVKTVPGPNNRLDSQPGGTLNLGADYRVPATPLTFGGSVNYTPGYSTRLSDTQFASVEKRRVVDAYALWVFNPSLSVRVSASNMAPVDFLSTGAVVMGNQRETARTLDSTYVNWGVRFEMKL